MRASACILLAVLIATPSPSVAWCDFNGWGDADSDGDYDPPPPFDKHFLFEIEDDEPGWDSLIGGVALSTNSSDPLYYRDVVRNIVDSSLQSWARVGRSPIKLGIVGFSSTAQLNVNDSRSTISVVACPQGSTGNADPGLNGTTCDITLEMQGSGCSGARIDTAAESDGFGGGIYRLLRHEIGHCLGMGHTCNAGQTAPGCGTFRNPEGECFDGPIMNNGEFRTDVPHGDDIEGLQKVLRGDTVNSGGQVNTNRNGQFVTPNSLLPRREIRLTHASYNTSNQFSFIGGTDLAVYSVYPARLDCVRGTGVDCVMVRAWTEDYLRFNVLNFSGQVPTLGTTMTVNGVTTRFPPDVAMHQPDSSTGSSTHAVAVVARQERSDQMSCTDGCPSGETCVSSVCKRSCTSSSQCDSDETCSSGYCTVAFNRPRSVSVHVFGNFGGTPSHSTFELDALSDDDITTYEPRVAYVRSLGGACSSGNCSNGWFLSSGKFVVAVLSRDRTLKLYVSTSVNGTSFLPMSEETPVGGLPELSERQIHEGFDIACPKHTDTAGTSADRVCRIVFNPYEHSGASEVDQTPNGELMECTVLIGAGSSGGLLARPTFQVTGCSPSDDGFGAPRGFPVSLSDYGTSVGTGQRSTRSWLLSASEPDPHNAATNTNLTLWGDTGDGVSTLASRVNAHHSVSDSVACDSMTTADEPMSYFGGMSTD